MAEAWRAVSGTRGVGSDVRHRDVGGVQGCQALAACTRCQPSVVWRRAGGVSYRWQCRAVSARWCVRCAGRCQSSAVWASVLRGVSHCYAVSAIGGVGSVRVVSVIRA
jgi:hypothetical protein